MWILTNRVQLAQPTSARFPWSLLLDTSMCFTFEPALTASPRSPARRLFWSMMLTWCLPSAGMLPVSLLLDMRSLVTPRAPSVKQPGIEPPRRLPLRSTSPL
jgi:hypothetical protein